MLALKLWGASLNSHYNFLRQWPVAFPELVDALVKETNLGRSQVVTLGLG